MVTLVRRCRGWRKLATAAELAPIILQAYGLTERERQVTELALQGLPSKQIALTLGISSYTVSDFLKSVFEKASVNSRTELAARLFFDHYYPNMGQRLVTGRRLSLSEHTPSSSRS